LAAFFSESSKFPMDPSDAERVAYEWWDFYFATLKRDYDATNMLIMRARRGVAA
jgi:hypothetical protein